MLFLANEAALRQAGLLAMGGRIIDITVAAAPKQRNTEAENAALKASRKPGPWNANPGKLGLLDVLAAVARKDYDDRRRRQAQGQERAKAAGLYRGRQEDKKRNEGIAAMLKAGLPWNQIQAATGCSRSTVARIAKRAKVTLMPIDS